MLFSIRKMSKSKKSNYWILSESSGLGFHNKKKVSFYLIHTPLQLCWYRALGRAAIFAKKTDKKNSLYFLLSSYFEN